MWGEVWIGTILRLSSRAGDKRGGSLADWQKVKIDRQIIATARVRGARAIYSDDKGVAAFAAKVGLEVIPSWAMPKDYSSAAIPSGDRCGTRPAPGASKAMKSGGASLPDRWDGTRRAGSNKQGQR